MKKLFLSLIISITIFGFESCTTEDIDANEQAPVTFSIDSHVKNTKQKNMNDIVLANDNESISVSMQESDWDDNHRMNTRTSWGNSTNNVNWVAGDKIGVSMRLASGVASPSFDRTNIQYNVATSGSASSALTPNSSPIYFPYPKSQGVNFYAYYPYSATANSLSVNYTLPTDQSTQQALSNADIMCSSVSTTNALSPNVNLNFNHKMVMLSFQIKPSPISVILAPTLTKVTVSGSAITNTGTLNLSNAVLTPSVSSTFSPFATKNQAISTSNPVYVDIIINPCILTNNANSSQLKVTLSFNGLLDHSTNLATTSGTFVGGTRYNYVLSVLISL